MSSVPTLRPATSGDEEFLFRLFVAVRGSAFSALGMPAPMLDSLLRMQLSARNAGYQKQYPGLDVQIVTDGAAPIGRLDVWRAEAEILLVDIALLPELRGRGIGARLIGDLIAEARERGVPIRLHVEQANPARRLYERLGFVTVEERAPHVFMERR